MINNLRRLKALTQWMKKQGVRGFTFDGLTVDFGQLQAPLPPLMIPVPSLTDEQQEAAAKKAFEEDLFHSAG